MFVWYLFCRLNISPSYSAIVVSVGNVSLSLVRSNEIRCVHNVSPFVSLKGPFVHSYEASLVSYVSTFTQFFGLLLSTFFQSLLRSHNISFSFHAAFLST